MMRAPYLEIRSKRLASLRKLLTPRGGTPNEGGARETKDQFTTKKASLFVR